MKLIICLIRDSAADAYGRPMFMANKGSAIRSFSDEVNNPREGNELNKHPSDFELFYRGTYDDQDGSFLIVDPPESLIRATDCVKKP